MIKQFKIQSDSFKEIRRKTLLKVSVLLIIIVAVTIIGSEFYKAKTHDTINTLPYLIPLIFVAMLIGFSKGLKRQKKLIDSYTLTITTNTITREQVNTPTMR